MYWCFVWHSVSALEYLFAEELGLVLETSQTNAQLVCQTFTDRGVPCHVIGHSHLDGPDSKVSVFLMPTSHIQRSPAEIVDRPYVAKFQIRQGVKHIFCLKCTLSHFGWGSGGDLRKLVIRNRPEPISKLTEGRAPSKFRSVISQFVDARLTPGRRSVRVLADLLRRPAWRPPTSAPGHK